MVSLVVSFPIINPLVNNESTVVIINPMVMDSTSDSTRFHIKTYENLAGKHAHPAHIGGPLLVYGWSCNWNCCSRSSTTDSGEKLAEIILSTEKGTNYKHERVYSLVTYTPNKNYLINVVKEKKKDGTNVESQDQSQDKSQDGTTVVTDDQSQVKSQDGTNESKDEYNIIWKTDKKEEYASKVTVDFYDAILTIYIGSGQSNKIVFKKGDDDKWTEDTQASTFKSNTTDTSGTTGTGTGTTATNQTAGGTTGTGSSGGGSTQKSTPTTQ